MELKISVKGATRATSVHLGVKGLTAVTTRTCVRSVQLMHALNSLGVNVCAARVHFVRPLAIFLSLSDHSPDKSIAIPVARQGTRLRSMTSVASLLGYSISVDLHPSSQHSQGLITSHILHYILTEGVLEGPSTQIVREVTKVFPSSDAYRLFMHLRHQGMHIAIDS